MNILPYEPLAIIAGDRIQWTRSFTDFPASDGWVLTYVLISCAGKLTITATASGGDFALDPDTAAWQAGDYEWEAYVSKTHAADPDADPPTLEWIERYTVGRGRFTVKESLAAATGGYDTRSFASRMVQQCEEAVEALNKGVKSYSIGDRQMTYRDIPEIMELLKKYKWKLYDEQSKAISAVSGINPRIVQVRGARVFDPFRRLR